MTGCSERSMILFYSSKCSSCNDLITIISRSQLPTVMHFISVDKRKRGPDGKEFAVLGNGSTVGLPTTLKSVPGLMLVNHGCRILTGADILSHLSPYLNSEKQASTGKDLEPAAFSFSGGGPVASDSFSFWDQSSEEMKAQGCGGAKQLHHYAQPGTMELIATPPDSWESDKKKPVEATNYQSSVNSM